MVSPAELYSTIESALLGPSPPTPSQRIELVHAIRSSLPSLRSLLSYPGPKASDRAQLHSKEVRLPDSVSPISLDDMDVQIAIKLSDDLNLNEIECIRLLVSANREWVLLGREPLEIYRLTAGLWYTERRDLLMSLYNLLRALVLDQGLDTDLMADIQKYLEDLFDSGLRQRLISLIKELKREEPSGVGGPNAESYVLDCKGAIVSRQDIVSRERLTLSHCLALSVLIVKMNSKDVKDVFSVVKDCAADTNGNGCTVQLQITFGLMFSLVISLVSDALGASIDKSSMLSHDASFRHEFHELVMATGNNTNVEGFVDVIRLAWDVHMIAMQDQSARETAAGTSSRDLGNINSCLQLVCSNNVFQFLLARVLRSAAYQNEDEDIVYMYNAYMHKLMMFFLSHPLTRDKVKEMKEKAMSVLSPYVLAGSDDTNSNSQILHSSYQPFISILELVSEIYQKEPELLYGNEDLWAFISFAGEDHSNIHTLVAFLTVLKTLASNEDGASKVFELLQGKTFRSIGWSTLFDCLSIYEEKFKQSLQSSGSMLPDFQEGDAQALVAYLNVLQKVIENGNPTARKKWFPDIEPLFKLLGYENVPPFLKGALRNAIAAFIRVSHVMKDTIWSLLEQYDLPVVVAPIRISGQHMSSQEAYEKLESHASQAADQEGGAAGTSMTCMSSERNDLWVQAVGRGKGGSVYGTGSLASQPSRYARALPPVQSTTGPAHATTSTGFLTMEQMATMMFDFQRQLRHITELVSSTSAHHGTAAHSGSPTVSPPAAPPLLQLLYHLLLLRPRLHLLLLRLRLHLLFLRLRLYLLLLRLLLFQLLFLRRANKQY